MNMTKKERIEQFAQNVRGNTELTGEKADTLRTYFKLCTELKALEDRVKSLKSVAVNILKGYGTATNNPNVKVGNIQVGVAIRRDNEVVYATLTTTQGSEVVEWQKMAEHFAKMLGVDDVKQFARQMGYITHRNGTTTLAINESARARKATGK